MKQIEIQPFDFENPEHQNALPHLAEWSDRGEGVLPLDEETIASHPYKLIAFDSESREAAGYIAITAEYIPEMVKMGAFIVNPELRSLGIGDKLIQAILISVRDHLPQVEMITAIVNEISRKKFESWGAKSVGERSVYWYFNKNKTNSGENLFATSDTHSKQLIY